MEDEIFPIKHQQNEIVPVNNEHTKLAELLFSIEKIDQGLVALKYSFNKAIDTQNEVNREMRLFKNKTKAEVERLGKELIVLKEEIESLKAIYPFLKKLRTEVDQLNEFSKKVSVSLNVIQGKEKREIQGGSITDIQHQDLIPQFSNIIAKSDGLSMEIISIEKGFAQRCAIRSAIASAFKGDIEFHDWFKGVLESGDADQNRQKFTDDIKQKPFESLFDEIQTFLIELKKVKPVGQVFFANVGDLPNYEREELISEKCERAEPTQIAVYPGYMLGDRVEKKAKVYTTSN